MTYQLPAEGGKRFEKWQEDASEDTIGRWELLDQYRITTRFPLDDLKGKFNSTHTTLDLRGVDQLPDVFFYEILETHGSVESITHVRLTGCVNVTDVGILWMSKAFPKLEKVELDACRLVTELSLHYLYEHCKSLKTISALGTDVGLIPDYIEFLKDENTTRGSPVALPFSMSGMATEKSKGEKTVYKAMIVNPPGGDINLLSLCLNGEVTEPIHLAWRENFTVDSEILFNIYQGHKEYTRLIGGPRTLYIVPYRVTDSNNVFTYIVDILRECPSAKFVLVPYALPNDKKEITNISEVIITAAKAEIKHLSAAITQWNSSKKSTSTFHEQSRIAQIINIRDTLTLLSDQETLVDYVAIGESIINMKEGDKQDKQLKDILKRGADLLDKAFPVYKSLNTHVQKELRGKVTKNSSLQGIPVCSLSEQNSLHHRQNRLKTLTKLEEYLHIMGTCVLIKGNTRCSNDSYVIWNPEKFIQEMNVMIQKQVLNEDFIMPCFNKEARIAVSQREHKAGYPFFEYLEILGLVHRVDKYMMMMHQIPETTPVALDHYSWPDGTKGYDTWRYEYKLLTLAPSSAVSHILSLIGQLYSTQIMSTSLIVVQETPVVLWVKHDVKEGKSIISVFAQMECDENLNKNYAWQLIEQVKLVVDFIMYKYCVPYALEMYLNSSRLERAPYDIPPGGLYMDHDMRTSPGSSHKCVNCNTGQERQQKLYRMLRTLNPTFLGPNMGKQSKNAVHRGSLVTSLPTKNTTERDNVIAFLCKHVAYGITQCTIIDMVCVDVEEGGLVFGMTTTSDIYPLGRGSTVYLNLQYFASKTSVKRLRDGGAKKEDIGPSGVVIKNGDVIRAEVFNGHNSTKSFVHLKLNGRLLVEKELPPSPYYLYLNCPEKTAPVSVVYDVSMASQVPRVNTLEKLLNGTVVEYVQNNKHYLASISEITATRDDHAHAKSNESKYRAETVKIHVYAEGTFTPVTKVRTTIKHVGAHDIADKEGNKPTFVPPPDFTTLDDFFRKHILAPVRGQLFDKKFENIPLSEELVEFLQGETFNPVRHDAWLCQSGYNKGLTFVTTEGLDKQFHKLLAKDLLDKYFREWDTSAVPLFTRIAPEQALSRYPTPKSNPKEEDIYIVCPFKDEAHHFQWSSQPPIVSKKLTKEADFVVAAYLAYSSNNVSNSYSQAYKEYVKKLLIYPDTISRDEWSTYNANMKEKITRVEEILLEIWDDLQKSKSITGKNYPSLKFNGKGYGKRDTIYSCDSHASACLTPGTLTHLPLDELKPHAQHIARLNFSDNQLTGIPDDFFQYLPNLQELNLKGNSITSIPVSIEACKILQDVDFSENMLTELPSQLASLPSLTCLNLSTNQFKSFPEIIFDLKSDKLQALHMANMAFENLPVNISNLKRLKILQLNGNCFTTVPPGSLSRLDRLEELYLSGVAWIPTNEMTDRTVIGKDAFHEILKQQGLHAILDTETRQKLFKQFDVHGTGTLKLPEISKFNQYIRDTYPRFSDIPEDILNIKSGDYKVLDLSYHNLQNVTERICQLEALGKVSFNYNSFLETLPSKLGKIAHIKAVDLKGCDLIKTPPREIVDRGYKAIIGYLGRLDQGSSCCRRTKLMMVGLGGAGKTSLTCALVGDKLPDGRDSKSLTDGINIKKWEPKDNGENIEYSIWDFAGQTIYYNTHQFFLSNRAVYLLLWNIRHGYEHAGLDFWLESIRVHAPDAPVFIVGSHRDLVDQFWIPESRLKAKYPQIKGFHYINVRDSKCLEDLKTDLNRVMLTQTYMNEQIPQAWLDFETKIKQLKSGYFEMELIPMEKVYEIADTCGIRCDMSEIDEVLQFFHDLGSIQYFRQAGLRHHIISKPQWVLDALACIVSVHKTAIKDGMLEHENKKKVWPKYSEDKQDYLLKLTEEFDLTFPIPDEDASLVPCMLPQRPTKFEWPVIEDHNAIHETFMELHFQYLPTGLFNRAQVRMFEFSDSSNMWRMGSYIEKNGHTALISLFKNRILLKVQGPRPENIVFMIHEVFETLIEEAFPGVKYQIFVPCPLCLKMNVHEPSMFSEERVRRAIELKADLLQCNRMFHTLTVADVAALIPPSSNDDYEDHLENCLRDLNNIGQDYSYDIFMLYCQADVPQTKEEQEKEEGKENEEKESNKAGDKKQGDSEKEDQVEEVKKKEEDPKKQRVQPALIKEELEKEFSVCFPEDPSTIDIFKDAVTMKNSKCVVFCVSDNFAADEKMVAIFNFINHSLKKPFKLLVMEMGKVWQKQLGFNTAGEVFVNMTNMVRYKQGIQGLLGDLKALVKTNTNQKIDHPECFISYCWKNSISAYRDRFKSLCGPADPRDIKKYLEKHGIKCWLDVEQLGRGAGLYEGIAEGLKFAKVCVVCMSDEYSNSENCQIEFRFAKLGMDIPTIIAEVGTGHQFMSKALYKMALKDEDTCIDFQTESRSRSDADGEGMPPAKQGEPVDVVCKVACENMLEAVKEALSECEETKTTVPESNKELAYQELVELAQRKILRQLVRWSNKDGDRLIFPHLVILDTVEDKMKQNKGGKTRPSSARSTAALRVRLLCEHEQGWHPAKDYEGVPLPTDSHEDGITETKVAPYMVRMLALLSYTGLREILPIFTTSEGGKMKERMEEMCKEKPEYKDSYLSFRKAVLTHHREQDNGGLRRCRMPNGKELWLCKEHRANERIRILEDENVNEEENEEDKPDDKHTEENLSDTEIAQGPPAEG